MSNKTKCAERVACEHERDAGAGVACDLNGKPADCPPGADDDCTVPTSDGGGELYRYESQIGRDEARALDHTMLALRTERDELKARVGELEEDNLTLTKLNDDDAETICDFKDTIARMTPVYDAAVALVEHWKDEGLEVDLTDDDLKVDERLYAAVEATKEGE